MIKYGTDICILAQYTEAQYIKNTRISPLFETCTYMHRSVIITCWTGKPKPCFIFSLQSSEWQSHPSRLLLPFLFFQNVYFIPSGKEAKLKLPFLPILCLLHTCDLYSGFSRVGGSAVIGACSTSSAYTR